MNSRRIKILIGCNEPVPVEAIKWILGTAHQDGMVFEFAVSERCNELIQQTCNGAFSLVVIYPNCLFPTAPYTLLEHSVIAIQSIKSSGKAPIIALTSMPEWGESLLTAGADVCLNTPFEAPEFRDAALRCLSSVRPSGLST